MWPDAGRDLTKAGVVAATKEALAIARANTLPAADRVRLAPATPTPDGRYVTPHTVDPFTVSIEQKADLLIRANTEAMKVSGVKFVNSNMFFVKEEKNYANTEGTFTTQTVIRLYERAKQWIVDHPDDAAKVLNKTTSGVPVAVATSVSQPNRSSREVGMVHLAD